MVNSTVMFHFPKKSKLDYSLIIQVNVIYDVFTT